MSDEISTNFDFYEFLIPLVPWAKGTDLLSDILKQVESQATTLHQLHQWKLNHLLLTKPTLNTSQTLVFWVHSSILDSVQNLAGVRGGLPVSQIDVRPPDSSTYKGKKQNPRPRRILLDIGCDDPALIKVLTQLGLEVELVWRQASDLLNYEIIEICTSQYIDMLVSTNGRLLTPPEEWLTYLMPQRTRLFFPPQELLESPKVLAQAIHSRAYTKQTRRQSNSTQLQRESRKIIPRSPSEEIHSE